MNVFSSFSWNVIHCKPKKRQNKNIKKRKKRKNQAEYVIPCVIFCLAYHSKHNHMQTKQNRWLNLSNSIMIIIIHLYIFENSQKKGKKNLNSLCNQNERRYELQKSYFIMRIFVILLHIWHVISILLNHANENGTTKKPYNIQHKIRIRNAHFLRSTYLVLVWYNQMRRKWQNSKLKFCRLSNVNP